MPNFWFTAARIAWRETRASAVKFIFVILGVANQSVRNAALLCQPRPMEVDQS